MRTVSVLRCLELAAFEANLENTVSLGQDEFKKKKGGEETEAAPIAYREYQRQKAL